jgi:uncharacterized membrane protein
MTDEQKKILQLEQELKRLSSQINFYRKQVNELKESTTPKVSGIEMGEEDIPVKKKDWEFPSNKPVASFKPGTSSGLESFIGLKLLHLTGIVVLVIGISIGVKYAVDQELISPIARIIMAYTAGLVLYFLSVRLKKKFILFSAILFSGAMASLYFTSYAAFVYYQLYPFGVAFVMMVLITIFTAYTAIVYDKQEIAILGMIGAYGIPFLISANSERADLFFAYIILINTGIVFLSYKKLWKAMVRLAMLVSWALFIGWAATRYEFSFQTEATIIMLVLYILFAIASLGFAISKKEPLGFIELQLFLLNNILAFAAALLVFTNFEKDNTPAAITGVACIVFTIQTVIARFVLPNEKLLFKYLAAFSVLSLVFYAGMRWDGLTVTMTWLAIAVALFAAGIFTKMAWLRLMSILLTGATLLKLIIIDRANFTTGQKIISYISIGVLLLLLSFFYQKFRERFSDEEETANEA